METADEGHYSSQHFPPVGTQPLGAAVTAGYQRALLAGACFALAAAALALLAPNTRQAKPADRVVEEQPVLDLAA